MLLLSSVVIFMAEQTWTEWFLSYQTFLDESSLLRKCQLVLGSSKKKGSFSFCAVLLLTICSRSFSSFAPAQFIARCWGDGTEEGGEAGVWWGNAELLLRGGLHLREHWERTVLFYLSGQSQAPTHTLLCGRYRCCNRSYWISSLPPSSSSSFAAGEAEHY